MARALLLAVDSSYTFNEPNSITHACVDVYTCIIFGGICIHNYDANFVYGDECRQHKLFNNMTRSLIHVLRIKTVAIDNQLSTSNLHTN